MGLLYTDGHVMQPQVPLIMGIREDTGEIFDPNISTPLFRILPRSSWIKSLHRIPSYTVKV